MGVPDLVIISGRRPAHLRAEEPSQLGASLGKTVKNLREGMSDGKEEDADGMELAVEDDESEEAARPAKKTVKAKKATRNPDHSLFSRRDPSLPRARSAPPHPCRGALRIPGQVVGTSGCRAGAPRVLLSGWSSAVYREGGSVQSVCAECGPVEPVRSAVHVGVRLQPGVRVLPVLPGSEQGPGRRPPSCSNAPICSLPSLSWCFPSRFCARPPPGRATRLLSRALLWCYALLLVVGSALPVLVEHAI